MYRSCPTDIVHQGKSEECGGIDEWPSGIGGLDPTPRDSHSKFRGAMFRGRIEPLLHGSHPVLLTVALSPWGYSLAYCVYKKCQFHCFHFLLIWMEIKYMQLDSFPLSIVFPVYKQVKKSFYFDFFSFLIFSPI